MEIGVTSMLMIRIELDDGRNGRVLMMISMDDGGLWLDAWE